MKIAIDGPAGAGKSTISKAVANRLGFVYIDTGAMYRAVGLAAIRRGVDSANADGVTAILPQIELDIKTSKDGQKVFLWGEDVSEDIRKPEVSVAASNVAVIPAVRLKLVELQRKLAERADVIMDGRDIGTYVLPDAELKIFLTASIGARAERRYAELIAKGIETTVEGVMTDMQYRDKNDSSRDFAPLKPADDSVLVDSTELSIEQTIEKILSLAEERS